MKNLQKVLCLVLAMVMMLSVMIVGAGAVKTFPDQKDIVNTEAVNMAVALNIIQGRDTGEFDPTGNVTRAEMAKMIAVLWNGGKEPMLGTTTQATYTDINGHWAEAYIEYCSALDFVAGMGDGTFNPWGNVTGTQAAKMMLVTLGFDPVAEGFNGLSWSTKIDAQASTKGLYADMTSDFSPSSPLSRDNAAQMLWNALQAYCVSYDSEIQYVDGQFKTVKVLRDKTDINNSTQKTFYVNLLYDRYDKAEQKEATLNDFSYDASKEEWTYYVGYRGDATGPASFTSSQDFTYLFKQNIKVVYNPKNGVNTKADTFYGMFADDSVVLAEGIVGDMGTVSGESKKVKLNGTEYKTEDTLAKVEVYNFGNEKVSDNLSNLVSNKYNAPASSIQLIDLDNNGKIDRVVVVPTTVEKVTYVNSSRVTAGNTSYKFEECSIYEGIAKDDFAVIVADDYTALEEDTLTKAETITGDVTGIKGDGSQSDTDKGNNQVRIDSTWYTLAGTAKLPEAGDTVKLTVVGDFAFDVDTTVGASKDILLITTNNKAETDLNRDYTVDARAYFPDGTNAKITIDKISLDSTKAATDITGDSSGSNPVASDALQNKLFTYSKDKSGNYELKALGDKNLAGGDKYVDKTAPNGSATYNASQDTIGGRKIADDAVIFVVANDKIKVQTGKSVKNWATGTTATVEGALIDEISSMNYVTYAALVVSGNLPNADGDNLYAYLTNNSYRHKTSNGDFVTAYDVWTGTENTTLYEDSTSNVNTFKEGTAIRYKEDGNYITNVTALTSDAIVGFDGKVKGDIELRDAGSYTLDDDCVVIAMDDKDIVGMDGDFGSVSLAVKDVDGKYLDNAYIAFSYTSGGAKDKVLAIVYDINGQLDEVTTAAKKADKAIADAKAELLKVVTGQGGSKTSPATVTTSEIAATAGNWASLFAFTATDVDVDVSLATGVAGNDIVDGKLSDVKYASGNVQAKLKSDYTTTDGDGKKVGLEITLTANDTKTSETIYVLVTLTDAT